MGTIIMIILGVILIMFFIGSNYSQGIKEHLNNYGSPDSFLWEMLGELRNKLGVKRVIVSDIGQNKTVYGNGGFELTLDIIYFKSYIQLTFSFNGKRSKMINCPYDKKEVEIQVECALRDFGVPVKLRN